jgi:sacsin
MPLDTQNCLKGFHERARLMKWLDSCVGIEILRVFNYGCEILQAVNNERLAIVFAHFLYHPQEMGYINNQSVKYLCALMPVIDNYGCLVTRRSKVLVPASRSNWFSLIGSNPWRSQNYIELSGEYGMPCSFAGTHTPENKLLDFMQTQIGAADLPYIDPPNSYRPAFCSPLTKENALLLLDWIRNMTSDGVEFPSNFLNCVKTGAWIKTSVGYSPPEQSFFL